MWPTLDSRLGLSTWPHAGCPGPSFAHSKGRGPRIPVPHAQSAGTPGKKPQAPSVKVKPRDFRVLVEILKSRSLDRSMMLTGPRPELPNETQEKGFA